MNCMSVSDGPQSILSVGSTLLSLSFSSSLLCYTSTFSAYNALKVKVFFSSPSPSSLLLFFLFFSYFFSFHFPFLSSSYSVLCLSLFPLLSVIEPVPCPPHPPPTNLSITFFSKCLFICAYSHDGFVWRARRLGSQLAGERARAPALLYFLPLSFFLK